MTDMKIGGRAIGPGHPVYIIAEMSCSHRKSLDNAKRLIDYAADAGADAIKFQLWMHTDEMTLNDDGERWRISKGLWAGRKLWDLYEEARTPYEWFPYLIGYALDKGVHTVCSLFSFEALEFAEFLDDAGIWFDAYKIASPELPWVDFIRAVAETGKPLFLSTAGATWQEIVNAREKTEQYQTAMLYCPPGYPAVTKTAKLHRMTRLPGIYGLSDHSRYSAVLASTAVAMGASVVERHINLVGGGGLDDDFAATPLVFTSFVNAVRWTEQALEDDEWSWRADDTDTQQWRRQNVAGKWLRAGPP